MRSVGSYRDRVNHTDLSDEEKKIIIGFLEWRTMNDKTRKSRSSILIVLAMALREQGSSYSTLSMNDIKTLDTLIKSRYKKNSQQTYITTLKAVAVYLDEEHHPIEKINKLKSIRSGSASPGDKTILSEVDWIKLLNSPGLKMRDRVMLQLLYDGFHRPGEILKLKWSDFTRNEQGEVSYSITFKTDKPRQIAQSVETTNILSLWRRELGTVSDDSPVFPKRGGGFYTSIDPLNRLFRKIGIEKFTPGSIRNTAITHDVERPDHNPSATCFKAWGKATNPMLSTYAAKADSLKLQRQKLKKGEVARVIPFGIEDRTVKDMVEMQRRLAILEKLMQDK